MKEVAGILYNDEPDEEKIQGKATVRIYYPVVHDAKAAKSNLEAINRICTEIIKEAQHRGIGL